MPAAASPSLRRPWFLWPRRLAVRWWRRQTPSRQDRFVFLGPTVSVLLFLSAMTASLWYLRHEETLHEAEAVTRAAEVAQQQIRLRLLDSQEQLIRLAREISTRDIGRAGFIEQAASLAKARPEILQVAWLGTDGLRRVGYSPLMPLPPSQDEGNGFRSAQPLADAGARQVFEQLRTFQQAVYTPVYDRSPHGAVIQVQVPLVVRGEFAGALVAEYAVATLASVVLPEDISRRHTVSVVTAEGLQVASTSGMSGTPPAAPERQGLTHDVPLAPVDQGLMVRAQAWRTSSGLISNTLFWMVVALSLLTVWMLLGSWRHLRRRNQIQAELIEETTFRRAMENSMLTGMRAIDLEGRITYVNPAFCAMTGFSESELIGQTPPYSYWDPSRLDETMRFFKQELSGRSPGGGVELRVRRKDGEPFDARMYVSPLVDARGQQTGWMASMTNITEAKRIRDQLSASHERFTTVLEGLDAAVSVVSVRTGELLFANRTFRVWFGSGASGHVMLADNSHGSLAQPTADDEGLSGLPTETLTESSAESREVYLEAMQSWFDVRTRYLQWTDGSLAQMLIATDITARRRAEEQAAAQVEKAQVTSRLITMGEMASSVAHELNQPLTAINNYCNGMVSRVKAGSIERDDLVAALEKTARQAERAGQIIHRIRAFVKRSEPQRQRSDARAIIEDAVELAGIDLRRRKVALHTYVAERLPDLMCDPILIEQVVLNLIKNAAEAIDNANMPATRRRIELEVVPRRLADEGAVIEFSVTDTGPGMPGDVPDRIYEAFFSTKRDGLGIGLGLCRSIVESHRGRIRAQNLYTGESVAGCRFSFTLPVDNPGISEPPESRGPKAAEPDLPIPDRVT